MFVRRKKESGDGDDRKPMYENCDTCGEKMTGIRATEKPARTTCEDCGGNNTDYHKGNPHPESNFRKRK